MFASTSVGNQRIIPSNSSQGHGNNSHTDVLQESYKTPSIRVLPKTTSIKDLNKDVEHTGRENKVIPNSSTVSLRPRDLRAALQIKIQEEKQKQDINRSKWWTAFKARSGASKRLVYNTIHSYIYYSNIC